MNFITRKGSIWQGPRDGSPAAMREYAARLERLTACFAFAVAGATGGAFVFHGARALLHTFGGAGA